MIEKIANLLNLRDGEDDRIKTLEAVKKNISFKGANLWILACAIIVASVGLNVNSTAVIIGAMLISPLMGPIVGAGFALGIYDFSLFKKSLKNLVTATLVSLIFSTLYFYISPFKDAQPELLSRTSPNIYDILIAFFGGIVGAIAVTRSEKGNPIPGVAIATALMPPLCTAGYGLATSQWLFFFGAFYLYIINCVFIGIATFLIIKFLKYPAVKQVDESHQRKVKYIIVFLITIMLLPSSYLAYSLYREQQFKKNVNLFIENEFTAKGYTVVYKKTDFNPKAKSLELAFLSKRFSPQEINTLKNKLNASKYLEGTQLLIRQDSTDRFSLLKGDILNEIKGNENEMNLKDVRISQLENELSKNKFDSRSILKEVQILFPTVQSLSLNKSNLINQRDSITSVTAVLYTSDKNLNDADTEKLKNWLNERLAVNNVELFARKNTGKK